MTRGEEVLKLRAANETLRKTLNELKEENINFRKFIRDSIENLANLLVTLGDK